MNNSNTMQQSLLLSAERSAYLIGVSRSFFYQLHSEAKVPEPIRLGKRVLWRKEELIAWTDAGCPDRLKWKAEYN